MEIIRENEKIVLKHESKVVEEYSFKENIDLKKLVELLLQDNLTNRFVLEDKLDKKTVEEENLVSVIRGLINDYNEKVQEYKEFIAEEFIDKV